MRYKIDENPEEKNEEDKNFLLTLKNVEDLPEDMQSMVALQANLLAESLQRSTDRNIDQAELNGAGEVDALAAVLTPFVMELAYLKINVAAISTAVKELGDGKSD